MGEGYAIPEELGPFVSNIRALLDQIKRDYPEVVAAEQPILLPLESLIGEGEGVTSKASLTPYSGNQKANICWWTGRQTRIRTGSQATGGSCRPITVRSRLRQEFLLPKSRWQLDMSV
jgi:hypothetical protein